MEVSRDEAADVDDGCKSQGLRFATMEPSNWRYESRDRIATMMVTLPSGRHNNVGRREPIKLVVVGVRGK